MNDVLNKDSDSEQAFGVYVHWPFCLSKCPYCDFNSHVRHAAIDEPRFLRAFHTEIGTDRRTAARPHRVVDLLRRRHAVLDAAFDHCRRAQFHRPAVARRARCRNHHGGQSDERRGRAFSRLSRRRRQSRVARRAGARRSRAGRARPAAHRARSARCSRRRAQSVRPLLVRPDLRAAGAAAEGMGGRTQDRTG